MSYSVFKVHKPEAHMEANTFNIFTNYRGQLNAIIKLKTKHETFFFFFLIKLLLN